METRALSPVFVGRTGELAALNDALARAAAGEPQAYLVGGEAGVGKTRLIEEFSAAAGRAGAVVALGGCVEIGAEGLPFAPFSAALRSLRRQLPDELSAAATGQEAELARLLPELSDVSPGGRGDQGRQDEEGMARLFELTARLLERLATDRTVVLVLEDLHWADASTRHLLAYLFRTFHGGRLVVIGTYRADDIHRRHPLRPLIAEMDRLRTVRRIELPRFNRTEVHRQLTGMLATEPDASMVDAVFERSDGNAFFVEELVCAHDGGGPVLPDSLRDLLLVRVEALPGPAQRVASVVAEGGSTVEYDLLAAVTGLPEDDLIEALRAAVGANILLASPEGDGYRFRHSLVREAVSDDLLPGERSRLNRRYAQALEAEPGLVRADERATRLASYWYAARDAAKALPNVLVAAVEARRRYAYAEQLRLLERAMELWEHVPEEVRAALRPADYAEAYPPCGCDPKAAPLRFIDLMAEAAVAGRLCGEREKALKTTKRALHLLEEEGDGLRAAWFWVQRSRLVSQLGRGDGGPETATAEELIRGLPPSAVHAEVLTHRATWGCMHDPGPEALTAAERAVEYARMVGADDIELNARVTRGGLAIDAGSVEEGLAELYEVRDKIVTQGWSADLTRVHVNLPSVLEGIGRSAESVRVATEGVEFARRSGLLDTEGWVWANLSDALISLGRWTEAAEAAERARRTAPSAKPRVSAAERLARLANFRGDWATAAEQLTVARELYGRQDPQPQFLLPLARISLVIAAAEGRIHDVREELDGALGDGLPPGTQRYGWPLLLAAATAEAESRGLPAAEPGRAQALECIRKAARSLATPVPVWQAHSQWLRAELRRAEDCDTPADWGAAHDALEPLENPFDLAVVRHRLAESLLARGDGEADRVRAAELLRLALGTAEELGARPLAEDVALLAQRARLSLTPAAEPAAVAQDEPTDPAEALGLTGRERDVLRLVAAGRSNRRIAEELFISPKTASVHVSHILAKLDVAGRGEAAALAHRLRLFPEQRRGGRPE